MTPSLTIGIDIGGTNTRAGLVRADGSLLARRAIQTQPDRGVDRTIARIVELARALLNDATQTNAEVSTAGVGCPGPISHEKGLIVAAPNLPGWQNVPLRDHLTAALHLPVTVENDANAAAFGEFTCGAGKGLTDIVMLTLGTGIGGGVIVNRALLRGAFDSAGEVGHMIVAPDGRECPCGQRGCLERYASARAIVERLTETVEAGERSILADRAGSGGGLTAEDVLAAARAGDEVARRVWDDACNMLAIACVNLQHLLNPQAIVLGGGMINAGQELLERVRRCFNDKTWRLATDRPQIELATLGDDAGIIGAAMLSRSQH